MLPFLEGVEHLEAKVKDKIGFRVEPWPLFIVALAGIIFIFMLAPQQMELAFSIALFVAPVWLPFLLVSGAWEVWIIWRRSSFIASQQYLLLEIKPPRNLVKTPLAMETFFTTMHISGGEASWYTRMMGGIRPFWSLEIASFEGQVHFFIWTRAGFRRVIESQLYAQYPGIQITEAPDYTRLISATPEEWMIWGCDFVHTGADPLPIKTYVEYGLDKVQKEPEQIDPLANIIEFMGSLGKGEYLWLQFVIRVHKGEKYGKTPAGNESSRKNKKGKAYTWKDAAEEFIADIRAKTRDTYRDPVTGEERPGFPNPTKGQSEQIAAIERNISKQAFDVGGRGIYIARPESVNGVSIAHLINLFKPFTTEGWNGINSSGWLKTFDDYPWEIGAEKKKNHYRKEIVEAYRRRQFYYDPFFEGGVGGENAMVMSTEELATVFHIPSRAIETPGLERIQSARSDAPANLPV
jgi:hypothetical protein